MNRPTNSGTAAIRFPSSFDRSRSGRVCHCAELVSENLEPLADFLAAEIEVGCIRKSKRIGKPLPINLSLQEFEGLSCIFELLFHFFYDGSELFCWIWVAPAIFCSVSRLEFV